MPRNDVAMAAFNRGLISPLGLARVDLKRTALSAALMTNWTPRVLGSMSFRAGLGYIGATLGNKKAYHVPFIFAKSDTAILEFTDKMMRVRINEVVITRAAVSAAITNGAFAGNLSGWTNNDEAGAVSAWNPGNMMSLSGTRYNNAIQWQNVACGNIGAEHALRIVVARGPVTLKVSSTLGDDDYIAATQLGTGTHSLAFTPGGNFYVQFSSRTEYNVLVQSVAIEAAGEMQIPAPWLEADLPLIRFTESADVTYIANGAAYQQKKIERRGVRPGGRSWSIVNYEPQDGPFAIDNTDVTRLTPSALTGNITITADRSYFKSSNVGSLIRITSIGQQVTLSAGGDGQFTAAIRVSGVAASRLFTYAITGTWAGTLTLQRSVGDTSSWTDVSTFTGNASSSLNDGFDNQIIYYRIGFKAGGYTSGTAALNLTYVNGGLTGIARVIGFNSVTSVNAIVLTPFGGTSSSELWAEGDWSPRRGYPSAVTLDQGRLWWAGKGKFWGSVSDAYESFDDTTVGDSGPVNRSIGSGPVDNINWVLPLQHLFMGSDTREISIRSSSLDEPLTPSNSNIKIPSTQGSAAVDCFKIDNIGFFTQQAGTKLYRLDYQGVYAVIDYLAIDTMALVPELGASGIKRIGAQRQIDTRVHCVFGDGTAGVLVSDPVENVLCWVLVQTDGIIEDVIVMPSATGTPEDQVYLTVKRTVNGATVRYFEKYALISECQGGTLNKQMDAFVTYSGAPTATITGLSHLEGKQVVCWADGKDMGGLSRNKFTVTGGQITLPSAVSNAVVGLYYEAPFQSSKLADAAAGGTALTIMKKLDHVGVIMNNTHYQGLRYGPDFDLDDDGDYANLDDLPQMENDVVTPPDTVWVNYDQQTFEFDGIWDTDSRLCLLAQSPRPCTLLAAVVELVTNG